MNVEELLQDLPIQGAFPGNLEVTGISIDSRKVKPGDLFVALTGSNYDGRMFAEQAVSAGAVAVLAEGPVVGERTVPWLQTENARPLLGPMSSRLWARPDGRLKMIGITGTNGKTTVAELVSAILTQSATENVRIGTLGNRLGTQELGSQRTTPEAPELFAALDQAAQQGAGAAVLEVSSHGLAQGRVAELEFDVALFTNLSRDHFDFHKGWEDYFTTKRRLFDQLKEGGTAVICIDDHYGLRLAAELDDRLTYGEQGDVRVIDADLTFQGIRAQVRTPRGDYEIDSHLIGSYNLSNLLAAVAVAEVLGLPHQQVAQAIARVRPVDGRLEPVVGQIPAFVDYAHTPTALEAALTALRSLGAKHLIVVFGCGGDRDAGKRIPMGQAASALADLAIATSDNPRNEDPARILEAVEEGLRATDKSNFLIEPNRQAAIRRAVEEATNESVILVAGKGHERVQIVGAEEIPFSDQQQLRNALEAQG